ncbi:carboxymuconolactone decarboxylase family protein [Pedobacter sp.]|uniref:carboxymuconolactone decarboxylase family protein n=1 Tax=Pedobacter sp. TaxID=1411316 RepID=UPI003C37366E
MQKRINLFDKDTEALYPIRQISLNIKKSSLGAGLTELVALRISQINNCAYSLDRHWKQAIANGERPELLNGLSAWRRIPSLTARECAALSWAEAVTNCNLSEEVYQQVLACFTEQEMINLTLLITNINTWNRLNLAFPDARVNASCRIYNHTKKQQYHG